MALGQALWRPMVLKKGHSRTLLRWLGEGITNEATYQYRPYVLCPTIFPRAPDPLRAK